MNLVIQPYIQKDAFIILRMLGFFIFLHATINDINCKPIKEKTKTIEDKD